MKRSSSNAEREKERRKDTGYRDGGIESERKRGRDRQTDR